jgi:hypothetical protein
MVIELAIVACIYGIPTECKTIRTEKETTLQECWQSVPSAVSRIVDADRRAVIRSIYCGPEERGA